MTPSTVNVFLTSFPGLGLPTTLCTPVSSSTSISKLVEQIFGLLPPGLSDRLILSTVSGQTISPSSPACVATLLSSCLCAKSDMLQLRLSVPLCGGKGGFGSQLRAAGGRMSSRKKRAQGENNGSNRNLDGRRLRTVTEAKALAEYLAVKPEMEKKEKEERRKRWEQVVESAQRREEEIKSGNGKGKIDAKWLEEKEEAESRTREAIVAAMRDGLLRGDILKMKEGQIDSAEESEEESEDDEEEQEDASSKATTPTSEGESSKDVARKVFGWDEEDEDMSDSDEDELRDAPATVA